MPSVITKALVPPFIILMTTFSVFLWLSVSSSVLEVVVEAHYVNGTPAYPVGFNGTRLNHTVLLQRNRTYTTSSFWSPSFWGNVRKSGYCEPVRTDAAVQEPVNSWSNFAYTLVGSYTIFHAIQDVLMSDQKVRVGTLQAHPWFAVLMGLTWCTLGVCSFNFHAAHVTAFWVLDVAFTNATTAALAGWSILALILSVFEGAARRPRLCTAVAAVVLIIADIIFIVYKRKMRATLSMMIMIGVILVFEFVLQPLLVGKTRRQASLTLGAVLSILGAFVMRQLEVSWGKPLCLYSRWFQPHAVWHVLSAGAIALLVLSWRSPFSKVMNPAAGNVGDSSILSA